jgi:peptidoglycan hydrolase CwlO-like protein
MSPTLDEFLKKYALDGPSPGKSQPEEAKKQGEPETSIERIGRVLEDEWKTLAEREKELDAEGAKLDERKKELDGEIAKVKAQRQKLEDLVKGLKP